MRLGNTNKGNTGKKYLMRTTISDKSFGELEAERTSGFNTWFVKNNHAIKQQWINKGQFNEDVFIDTYIRICEAIAFSDYIIKDYQSYFSRSYYTNYILNKKKGNRFQDIDILCIEQEQKGDIHLFETEYNEIISIIFSKTDNFFSAKESKIFKDFLLWKENQPRKDGGSYLDFSKIAGEKLHEVQNIVSKGKEILKNDKCLNEKINNLYSLL